MSHKTKGMTISELKAARERWNKHCLEVSNFTFVNPETPEEKAKRIVILRKDYRKFVEYYFPH